MMANIAQSAPLSATTLFDLQVWSLLIRQSFGQFFSLFGAILTGSAALSLISRQLNGVFQKFMWPNFGLYAFGIVGVPVHEFAHALFAKIFLHDVQKITWFSPPKGHGTSGGNLGSVTHSYNPWNPYHRIGHFFIGLGPALLGPLLIALLFRFLVPNGTLISEQIFNSQSGSWTELRHLISNIFLSLFHRTNLTSPGFWFFLYLSLAISSQIELSNADLRQVGTGILPIFISLLFINAAAWLAGWKWHPILVHIGHRFIPATICVFVFAIVITAFNFAVCFVVFNLIHIFSGRESISAFRTSKK